MRNQWPVAVCQNGKAHTSPDGRRALIIDSAKGIALGYEIHAGGGLWMMMLALQRIDSPAKLGPGTLFKIGMN